MSWMEVSQRESGTCNSCCFSGGRLVFVCAFCELCGQLVLCSGVPFLLVFEMNVVLRKVADNVRSLSNRCDDGSLFTAACLVVVRLQCDALD